MSTPIKNIVIAGAGGNLGAPTLEAFLSSSLNVSVLTREDSKSTFPEHVNVIKTDYTKESLVTALKGQDAVVSYLGATAIGDPQVALLEAAVESGVKRFIPSEFGHNTASETLINVIPIFGTKAKFIDRIKTHPSITWTAVITGLFFDWGIGTGFLGANLKDGTANLWDDGSVPFSTTNTSTIGKSLVKLLTDPAAYKDSENAYIYLASHTITQAEFFSSVEKATGKKLEVTKIDGASAISESKEKLSKGDFSGIGPLIQSVAFTEFDGETLTDFRKFGIFNDKHGIKDLPLDEDVQRIVSSK